MTIRAPVPISECGILLAGAVLWWLVNHHPASLPWFAPWEFSWAAYLGTAIPLLWFVRGNRGPAALPRWRSVCFFIGIAAIYGVLMTRFELLSQHMFFFNRIQHAVMHHLGPFLIALSWPQAPLSRGMPLGLRRLCDTAPVRILLDALQRPVPATLLFEGLLFFWLLPPVMYVAMLNTRLYWIMNASMVLDGLLFWCVVLDPRPSPPLRSGYFARAAMAFLIIFPQIAVGTLLGLAQRDLYPSFALCGRVYAAIGPLADQQIGGLILWVPAGMMSAFATIVVMSRMFRSEGLAQMAGDQMVGGDLPQGGRFRPATRLGIRAARVEVASRRGADRAGDVAGDMLLLPFERRIG
jgi:putative membrane protein